LGTHTVTNQVPPLGDINLYGLDRPLQEALNRNGAGWAEGHVRNFGAVMGTAKMFEEGRLANVHPPELRTHDRYGHRIDEVRFHPAYHNIMQCAKENRVHSIAWEGRKGGHVAHAALEFLLTQVEAGTCCPLTMSYAAVPALEKQGGWAAEIAKKLKTPIYDSRFVPISEKEGITMGMAMTEKQGGSDVRANTTHAMHLSEDVYLLQGHKWFCSAPMSDAFLTLAQTQKGLTCFFVPRIQPDGTRNPFFIQRLKNKLGNRSNASAEIEYQGTWARRLGEEGRGVPTIIEMVHHTRLDCAVAAVGLQRQALTQALHHAQHRSAFGGKLIEQPLMQNVLADLSLEFDANLSMVFRVAHAYDEQSHGEKDEGGFSRLAVAIAKYWTNKRTAYFVNEAMECLGGAGYIEESILPRLYREAPLNGIWEGSGNVICLDILRTIRKEPESLAQFFAEVEKGRGVDSILDRAIDNIKRQLNDTENLPFRGRFIVEQLALVFQGSLLARHGSPDIFEAFLQTRIFRGGGMAYGTFSKSTGITSILERMVLSV
jgi:putative acyl-CoA dehydrogenase